ncbi:MAG: hypothetical protein ACK45D_00895 [Alphaproteobacteria bacterium]|jgi:hypothetical protein
MERSEEYDAAYAQGFQDGKEDILKSLRNEISRYKRNRDYIMDVLTNPEKLAEILDKDDEISSTVITAVIAKLIADSGNEIPN